MSYYLTWALLITTAGLYGLDYCRPTLYYLYYSINVIRIKDKTGIVQESMFSYILNNTGDVSMKDGVKDWDSFEEF